MTPTPPRLFLASQSPRRQALLEQLRVPFTVLPTTNNAEWVDETPLAHETAQQYAIRLACAKARAGWAALTQNSAPSTVRDTPPALVLGADTTVARSSRIFGKPQNAEDAVAMLRALSNATHEVITAVALTDGNRMEYAVSRSTVRFAPLPEAWITAYVASGEPLDKAGAYAYQGAAAAFIPEIRGSASGIIGLPLFETAELLARFGLGPHCAATLPR
ncbi:Maf family protein [Hydrogenophilus thiooxidans]|uniref:Maf family protein n=1 Tax=Hydrogenophilus thiooxidans TaxID=2820326 RepID=UPI001C246111|nr:nucleoside triphosphate pyrophosphatase [Hydrogenophilus thiooxidans]